MYNYVNNINNYDNYLCISFADINETFWTLFLYKMCSQKLIIIKTKNN